MMFFKKSGPPAASKSATPSTGERSLDTGALRLVTDASPAPQRSSDDNAGTAANDLGLVLDALGSMLGSFARYTFDIPDRPATETSAELLKWQRHATLGVPLVPESGAGALGVHARDWNGVVRSFSEQRRGEKRYVDSAVGDLREALWACIETVHNAVRVDVATDQTVATQMLRARKAITSMEIAAIKSEVMGALNSLEGALQSRRVEQESQYRTLAGRLDKLRGQLEEARLESTTDGLTGLGNRKLFDTALSRVMQYHTLGREPVTLLMIDIDGLKIINDTFGHPGGDAAIVSVARCLSRIFLRQTDTVCRFGGDEFAAILPNTDAKMALTLAKRLVAAVREIPAQPDMTVAYGVSIGLAEVQISDTAEVWLGRADKALYTAKQEGRSCAVLAES
jgi:diguanylate cyclase (GGDEF)-like protein